ncbi:MAG: creatininase family protein [Saccharofermentanales bacterium]|jgi:creatinine amidohydrolase
MVGKMRTRILARMNNYEVEEYLDRNDIIFIPVGPTEMHGRLPLEVEYVGPFGMSVAMAEKVDGLVLDGLKYFYNGSCATGRGTVRMSVNDGYHYLKAIAYSLLSQGFNRQIYITGHGTSELTLGALVADFFDETKCPIAWIDQMTVTNFARRLVGDEEATKYNFFRDVTMGSYEILGRKGELIVDSECAPRKEHSLEMFKPGQNTFQGLPESMKNMSHIINFGSFAYSLGFYFGDIRDHGGDQGAFSSEAERDQVCQRGLAQLLKVVDTVDMPLFVQQMADQAHYTNTFIKEKFGKTLPKNKVCDWN